MRCHQISSVAVCVELTEFLDSLSKMPNFKTKFTFFRIVKANKVKNPDRVMTKSFFRYFDFEGLKS